MATLKLAFDRGSVRSIDADGRLHVAKTHISKSNVCPYYGKEIPNYEGLGLDPTKIYRLLRDPVELERGADSFARIPVQIEHVHTTADNPKPLITVGAIGSNVSFTKPYLDADLSVWDAKAIAGIETGDVQELSCAYRYVAVMESGEYEGEPFDGRMTQIEGSHVCLVPNGRAGSDVLVADSNPFARQNEMKNTKLGLALIAAMTAISPKLALDAALVPLLGETKKAGFDKADVSAKLVAMDASLDGKKLEIVMDAIMDVEKEPDAAKTTANDEDESEEDKKKRMAKEKMAEDEDEGDKKKPDVKAAMDAMRKEFVAKQDQFKADMKAANDAARDVRPTCGEVAMDSAAEIYGFALDQLKVDHKDIAEVPALRALYKVATSKADNSAPKIATDAAALEKRFPNATRFSHA